MPIVMAGMSDVYCAGPNDMETGIKTVPIEKKCKKAKWLSGEALQIAVKEESEKVDLNLNIQKTKIMASGPITSWQIDKETMATVKDFIYLFFWLQIHCRW